MVAYVYGVFVIIFVSYKTTLRECVVRRGMKNLGFYNCFIALYMRRLQTVRNLDPGNFCGLILFMGMLLSHELKKLIVIIELVSKISLCSFQLGLLNIDGHFVDFSEVRPAS